MKKLLMILSAAVLLFTGCAKENSEFGGEGNLVNVTISAKVKSTPTRADVDNDGQGVNANRCIMELWYANKVYGRYEAAVTGYQATFNVTVPAKRTYQVVLWADCATDNGDGTFTDKYYNTSDNLANITLNSAYVGNDDARDAFYYSGKQEVTVQGGSFNATLTRPFAQINVITTDVQDIKMVELYPEKVNLAFKAATSFNAVEGTCGELEDIEYEASVYKAYDESKSELTLSMDYLFASDERSAVDIAFVAPTEGTFEVEHEFSNIPYQRNYRTNIKGALLTTTGQWTITIEHNWTGNGTTDEDGDDPYLVNYYQTGSIAAANEALKTNNAVSIENPSDLGTAIVIPTEQDGKNVFIAITGATNGDIVVKQPQDGEGPATLGIESDSKTLDINLPKSHVDVNNGVNYDAINAKTGDNTLVIGKDVKVKKLTTTKGAVVINGQVEELSSNAVAQINISTAEGLMAYAAAFNAKKYTAHYANLVADIDMTGKEWVPMSASNNSLRGFDGEEHTISNLTTTESAGAYYGLFMSASFDIKNVTVKDAVLTYPSSVNDQARAGVIVGWLFSGNVTNCHVDGATIKASQKIGGIVGNVEASTTNPMTISDCSVKNLTVSSNCNDLVYQAAGIVGYIQQVSALDITVKNCSVENITVNDAFTGSNNAAWHNHSFIGNIENTKENTVIALENNTVAAQLPVERTVYTTDYFGWAGNAEKGSNYKAVITIDGTPWTPDYPVQIVGGAKYATLSAALAAATEGQTVQILKAGDYTVETLSTKAAVVEATVEGVVFNHTPGYGKWVSAENGYVNTVKNITWNVGEANYQYFDNTNLENCTVNGQLCTHGTNKFKDCTFINEEGYNFWVYGNEYTEFENCTFTCPGKNDGVAGCGSAINCYNEGAQTPTPILVVKNCTFTAKEASNKYSAIYIKPETAFDIRITNSTCNDKFCTGAISGSKLWNLKSDREGTTVSIDGTLVYPFCSKDADGNYHIVNAAGLLQFHDLYAAGKVAYTAKVYLDNDIDFTGKTWTACEWHADGTNKGFALFDGQNHTIKNFTVSGQGMFSRWACTSNIGATPYFKDIVFDGAKNVTSTLNVSLFCGQTYQNAKIENVTIKNSQFEGKYKVAPFVGTVYDENATGPTLTLKDCKVENTTVKGTSYDFDICGMVAWVYEENNDKIAFEGNNVVKDVTLYIPKVSYDMCAKIYHNGETAYDAAANVTVNNVNVVIAE